MTDAPLLPLCVDLDGTLVRNDTLWQSICRVLRSNPLRVFPMLFALRGGYAKVKALIGDWYVPDASALPYRGEILEYLKAQKSCGRMLVLATGSDVRTAQAVQRHLAMFDLVLGSDGVTNLSGDPKARELVRRFGEKGFAYIGNSTKDIHVWSRAGEILVAGNEPGLDAQRAAATKIFS